MTSAQAVRAAYRIRLLQLRDQLDHHPPEPDVGGVAEL
jgi:hypothetical protein